MAQSFPMWTHCCCPQRGKAQERIFHVEKQKRIVWQIYDEARECIEVRRGRGGIRNRCSMKWKRIAAPTTPYRTSRPIAALRRPRTHLRRLEKISHTDCCRRSLTQTYSGVKRRGGAACPWCSSSRRRRLVGDSTSCTSWRRADLDLRPVRPEGHAPEVRCRTPRCEALRREVSSTRGSSENSSVRGSAERGLLNTRFVVVPPRRLTLRCEALRGEVSSTRGSSANSSVRGSTERELLNTRFVA
jgi:hypothetical protein